jgi:hypothetical protein
MRSEQIRGLAFPIAVAVALFLVGASAASPVSNSQSSSPSVLLGVIDDAVDFGDYAGAAGTGQHFALTYQTSALLPNPDPSLWPFTYCIGCDTEVPLGWTGVIDFTAGVGYTQFVGNLMNRVNDGSLWQLSVLTSSGRLAGAFGSVADEYDWFAPRAAPMPGRA